MQTQYSNQGYVAPPANQGKRRPPKPAPQPGMEVVWDAATFTWKQRPIAPAQSPAPAPGYVASPAPAPAPATEQPAGITSGLDFEAELEKLLGADPMADEMDKLQYEKIKKDMTAPDWGEADQKILDESIALAKSQANTRDAQNTNALAAAGLRGGGTMVKRYAESTNKLANDILQSSIAVKTRALERNAERRAMASQEAARFASAIRNKNAALATALLQAHQADLDSQLSKEQMELQKQMFQENLQFNRDQFTEEQRARLVKEGFDERQISMAEEQQMWERAFRERQQMADEKLADKNWQLQNKIADASISAEEKRLALTEIKNNADINLQDRIQQLAEQFGLMDREFAQNQFLWSKEVEDREMLIKEGLSESEINARLEAQKLDREKFNAMTKQIENEFGLSLNQFELDKFLKTKQLDFTIAEADRRFDLDKASDAARWRETEQARLLQEKLGMSEIEMKKIIAGEEIEFNREVALMEKWMFEQGLAFEKQKYADALKAAKAKKKGGLFGKIIKTIAGVGMGIAGAATGNPALIAAGASTAFGGSQQSNLDIVNSIVGTQVGHIAGSQIGQSGPTSTSPSNTGYSYSGYSYTGQPQ